MIKTLQLLSMMNDNYVKRNMRLLSFVGCFFAIGICCAASDTHGIQGLSLVSYFIFLIQLIQMNQGIIGNNSIRLELLYQTDRKNQMLKIGLLLYNLSILLGYLICAGICILIFSFFKDISTIYIPLLFVIVISSFYTTVTLIFQIHGYHKVCGFLTGIFILLFMVAVILPFMGYPLSLEVTISVSSLPYVFTMMILALLLLVGIDLYLYKQNKGLKNDGNRK